MSSFDSSDFPPHVLRALNKMIDHNGLVFPYSCSACTFDNSTNPASCPVCGTDNSTFDATIAAEVMKGEAPQIIEPSCISSTPGELSVSVDAVAVAHRKPLPPGKALFVVVHLIHVRGMAMHEHTLAQAEIAFSNGADGIFLCPGEGGLTCREIVQCYQKVREQFPSSFIGINFLASPDNTIFWTPGDADALWTDYGVDFNGISSRHYNPACKISSELRGKGWLGHIFGAFFFKGHNQTLPTDSTKLENLSGLASRIFDVRVTSGAGTGIPMDPATLSTLRGAYPGRLAVASGVNEENIRDLITCTDYFLIGTGVEVLATDPETIAFYQQAHLPPSAAVKLGYLDADRVSRIAAIIAEYNAST